MHLPPSSLTSPTNPRVKALRALAVPKGRRQQGRFLLEGAKALVEALLAGHRPDEALATEAWLARFGHEHPFRGVQFTLCSEAVLRAVATTEHPDGVVAAFPLPLAPEALPPQGVGLVAHGLQDPGNLGTLVRAAAASGAAFVAVTGQGVDPWGPKAVRASMGACFRVPLWRGELAELTALWPHAKRVLLDMDGAQDLWAGDWADGATIALMVGQEGQGLDEEARAWGQLAVGVPMAPGAPESLNAAMAGTLALFEAFRRRR